MVFALEDFSALAPIRMSPTPSEPTEVSLIFFRLNPQHDEMKVLFGFTEVDVLQPEENSIYSNMVQFELALVKEICKTE